MFHKEEGIVTLNECTKFWKLRYKQFPILVQCMYILTYWIQPSEKLFQACLNIFSYFVSSRNGIILEVITIEIWKFSTCFRWRKYHLIVISNRYLWKCSECYKNNKLYILNIIISLTNSKYVIEMHWKIHLVFIM